MRQCRLHCVLSYLVISSLMKVSSFTSCRNTQIQEQIIVRLLQKTAVVYQWWSLYLECFVAHRTSVSVQRTSNSCYLLTYLITYWPKSRLYGPQRAFGIVNYRRQFLSVHCLLSPSFNFHLPWILFSIFHPSRLRSYLSSGLLSNSSLITLPWSILTVCTTHYSLFILLLQYENAEMVWSVV